MSHTHSHVSPASACTLPCGLISFLDSSISKKSPCQSQRPKSNLSILCMFYAAAENTLFYIYEFPNIPDPSSRCKVVACLCGARCVLGSGMVEALDSARCRVVVNWQHISCPTLREAYESLQHESIVDPWQHESLQHLSKLRSEPVCWWK